MKRNKDNHLELRIEHEANNPLMGAKMRMDWANEAYINWLGESKSTKGFHRENSISWKAAREKDIMK